jgi:hypothetical protein
MEVVNDEVLLMLVLVLAVLGVCILLIAVLRRPIPVAARSKVWVCGRSLAGIASSNPARDMSVSCECCVLSCSGLCVGPITRPEESYLV